MSMENDTKTKKAEPRRVRGTAIFHDDDSMEFTPQGKGEPVQRSVKKLGDSRFYETEGEGQSSYVCHLKVDKTCADPAAEMEEQLQKLTANIRRKEPKTSSKTKMLTDTEQLKVWHARKSDKVKVLMEIDCGDALTMSAQLFNLTQEVNKCLAINKTSLRPRKK